MTIRTIDARAETSAEPATVWALLADSSTWPSWTPIESFEIERAAEPDGTGEIRTFTTGRVTVREQIVVCERERRLSYVLLAGLAVRDYRADIGLSAGGGSTQIDWHTAFSAKVPGSGWLYRRALEKATRAFVEGLVARAEFNEGGGNGETASSGAG